MAAQTDSLTMPSSYSQLILREWGTTPELDAALRSGLSQEALAVIDVNQQMLQLRTMNQLLPSDWGLRLGSMFDATTHGLVGVGVASAKTLGEALDVIGTFGHLRTPFMRFETGREGRRAVLRFYNTAALGDTESLPLHEATMVGVQTLLRRIVGSFDCALVEFDRPRPNHWERYADFLQGELRFDRDVTALSFDATWLTHRSPLADEEIYRAAIGRLLMDMRAHHDEDPLLGKVRRLVAAEAVGVPSLKAVCAKLGFSNRTLVRKLQSSGTCYREIVDTRRRERAELLLSDDSMAISELGYLLGYSDIANFGRSCRRWFGASPAGYRRKLLLHGAREAEASGRD